MVDHIALSANTKKIIHNIVNLKDSVVAVPDVFKQADFVDLTLLLKWLSDCQQVQEDHLFFLESLYSLLLIDLYDSLPVNKDKEPEAAADWFATLKFILLAIAGTIFFGCEGFDRITSILSITSLPSMVIFAAGVGFSLLSIVVFFAFDLVEISKNLGVDLNTSHKIVDVYLQQVETIKALRKAIDASYSTKDAEQIQTDIAILEMLSKRYQVLEAVGKSLKLALDNPMLYALKLITAGIAGIIFFSGGFVAGQTLSMAILGLFMAGVTPLFWPVIVGNLIAGIAALSVYWFVERPGIEDLIGRWVGLDKDKLSILCDESEVQREQNHILSLVGKLDIRRKDLLQISEGERKIKALERRLQHPKATPETTLQKMPALQKPTWARQRSANSFFSKPEAGNDAPVVNDLLTTGFSSVF